MDEWTIDLKEKLPEYETEFGCTSPVHFAGMEGSPWTVKMGTEILCECGKPATQTMIGKHSYLAKCEDCWNG